MQRLGDFVAAGKASLPEALHDAFDLLASWDRGTQRDNRAAALAVLTLEPLIDFRRESDSFDLAAGLERARDHLLEHFGRIDPPYREVVRHVRGARPWSICISGCRRSRADPNRRGPAG